MRFEVNFGYQYDTATGVAFDIVEMDRTRGFKPGTRTQDIRFWGKCLDEPSLFVEFDDAGNALSAKRLNPAQEYGREERWQFLTHIKDAQPQPIDTSWNLVKRSDRVPFEARNIHIAL